MKCDNCGKDILRKDFKCHSHKKTHFCDRKCLSEYRRFGKEIACNNCGKMKYFRNSLIKKQKYFFCSKNCYNKHAKIIGKKVSIKNENHWNWKGKDVKYGGVHRWIKRHKEKSQTCEHCNKKRKLDLANISDKYKRDIDDYLWLCRSCHEKYDNTKFNIIEDEIKSIEFEDSNEIFYDIETETSNFIANGLITHNSKPHKKSYNYGVYMPDTLKESVELSVVCDLSGSIGQEEFNTFFSEIVGMARAFQNRVDMSFYSHDTRAYNCGKIRNGNIEEIQKIKLKGGGGTSHIEIFDMLQKDKPKLAIFLTDAYSDLEEIDFDQYQFKKVFVIVKGGTIEPFKDKCCEVLQLQL